MVTSDRRLYGVVVNPEEIKWKTIYSVFDEQTAYDVKCLTSLVESYTKDIQIVKERLKGHPRKLIGYLVMGKYKDYMKDRELDKEFIGLKMYQRTEAYVKNMAVSDEYADMPDPTDKFYSTKQKKEEQ